MSTEPDVLFCQKCGKELVRTEVSRETLYDRSNGKPYKIVKEIYRCPDYQQVGDALINYYYPGINEEVVSVESEHDNLTNLRRLK